MTTGPALAAPRYLATLRLGGLPLLIWPMALVLLSAGYFLDHHPRFMLGDSESYLRSGLGGFYPPDRSWIYGVLVREIVSRLHSLQAYILLQLLGVMSVALLVIRRLGRSCRLIAASLLLLGLGCDPLVQTYARFYLSDLSAALLFVAFVVQFGGPPATGRTLSSWVALAACGIGAILLRIAYLPIETLTVLLCLAISLLRRERRRFIILLPALLVPVLGACTLAGANRMVFMKTYPGEIFLNHYSGTFLMSVFGPTIAISDIRSAGIPVTEDEFRRMRLDDYDKRNAQIWGTEPFFLHNFMLARLHAQTYDTRADRAASDIVHSALRRDPMAFLRVYANGLLSYAEPSQWARNLNIEMGGDRLLSESFVSLVDFWVPHAVEPRSALRVTIWPRLLARVIFLYPLLLAGGLMTAVWALAATRNLAVRALSAGIVADVLTVPLYSSYVIPRYLLAAVLLGWCLLWLLAVHGWYRAVLALGTASGSPPHSSGAAAAR